MWGLPAQPRDRAGNAPARLRTWASRDAKGRLARTIVRNGRRGRLSRTRGGQESDAGSCKASGESTEPDTGSGMARANVEGAHRNGTVLQTRGVAVGVARSSSTGPNAHRTAQNRVTTTEREERTRRLLRVHPRARKRREGTEAGTGRTSHRGSTERVGRTPLRKRQHGHRKVPGDTITTASRSVGTPDSRRVPRISLTARMPRTRGEPPPDRPH